MTGPIKTPRATLVRAALSASGPNWAAALHMSASGGKADTGSLFTVSNFPAVAK